MATLQTNIPMMVDVPDIGNALARGMQAGQMAYTNRRGYEADQFKAQNANALMQGDPAALAGLAGYDFDQAQQARIGALNARTAEHRLSAAEAAQTAAELESVMRPLAIAYGKGDQRMFEQALARHPELAGQITWDNFEAIAAETATVYEQLQEAMDANAPDYKVVGNQLVRIDGEGAQAVDLGAQQGYRPATPEEAAQYGAAAGQIDTSTGRFYPINPPSGMSVEQTADGFKLTQGPGVTSGAKLTETQSKDTVFVTRAEGALSRLEPVADTLTDRLSVAGDSAPMGLGRELQSDEYQVARGAGTEFLQAILRKDTGAAITPQEQKEYGGVYLPQPGDTPAMLAYRKEARRRAVEAIKAGLPPQAILAQEQALQNTSDAMAESAPEAGTVEDGYRFKGGDAADPANWEKIE